VREQAGRHPEGRYRSHLSVDSQCHICQWIVNVKRRRVKQVGGDGGDHRTHSTRFFFCA
jgi:hypothetical protein